MQAALASLGVPVRHIGVVRAQQGLLWRKEGTLSTRQWQGYRHFSAAHMPDEGEH